MTTIDLLKSFIIVGVDAEVYKTIPTLKKASMIRRVGPTKGGYWEVSE